MGDTEAEPTKIAIAIAGGTSTTEDGANATPAVRPAWTTHYDNVVSKVPSSLASKLPTSSQAASTVDKISGQFSTIRKSGREKFEELRGTKTFKGVESRFSAASFLGHAYSITNETAVDLNVSLNQVGPLMYQVLAPGDVFERRVPNVWYSIEVRPYTDPSSAYNSWSVAWPVLAVTGPVLAAVFFGGTVVSAAGTVAASAASLSASAASLAAKASRIPGGSKLKARLVEAAKKNLVQGQKVVQERVVRYFMEATAVEAAVAESERMRKRREENQRKLKERKLVEVDVTGLELEKVLRCQTGKRKVDKALTKAFKDLSFKEKTFKTSSNPVLVIVGGPELEVRETFRGKKEYLVFYPFLIEPLPTIIAQPIPSTELPPTETEAKLIEDTHVVETVEEAEAVVKTVPVYSDAGLSEEKKQELEKAKEGTKLETEKGKKRTSWFGFGGARSSK